MAIKITLESFLAVLRRSGLIEEDKLESLLEQFTGQSENPGSTKAFAEFLLAQKVITRWQAEKLVQGKHKGFFLGKYRLLSLLGTGGMSSVYLAEHVLMRRQCAIKVLPHKRVNDASYLGRFHREAQAVAALDHPNIVRAYDVDHETDKNMEIHFLVMEFVPGASLQQIVERDGAVSQVDAVDVVRQASLGLEHAHQAGLVHRDIKPGNLLVDPHGTVKLLDLGLARFFEGDEESLTIQHDEKVLGTADYLAPEQAIDSHSVDKRADIYSLGCTLYYLLVAHPPFDEGTLAQRLMAHQTRPPKPVVDERPDISADLLTILHKMMAKLRDDRYQSAMEVADACGHWLEEHGGEEWAQRRARLAQRSSDSGMSPSVVARQSPDDSGVAATAAGEGSEPEFGAFLASLDDGSGSGVRSAGGRSSGRGDATSPSSTVRRQTAASAGDAGPSDRSESATATVDPPQFSIEPDVTPDAAATAIGATTETAASPVTIDTNLHESSVVRRSSIIRKSRSKRSTKPLVIVGALGAVLAVCGLAYALFGRDDDSPAGQTLTADPASPETTDVVEGDDRSTAAVAVPSRSVGKEMTAGPEGDFPTITAAINYLQRSWTPQGGEDERIIQLTPGHTYNERIVIDNSGFSLTLKQVKIICGEGEWARLRSDDEGPLIELTGVEGSEISGLVLESDDRPAVVRLSGYLSGTVLRNMRIEQFKQIGVESAGATALRDRPFVLQAITFAPSQAEAVATSFREGASIFVHDCRFLGPMSVGIDLSDSIRHCEILKNVFYQTGQAIRFGGDRPYVADVRIECNTFLEGEHALAFESTPAKSSNGVRCRKNLFTLLSGAEGFVQSSFEQDIINELLSPAQQSNNWTDRAHSDASDSQLNLFATDGKTGIAPPKFVSTTPGDAGFAKPKDAQFGDAIAGDDWLQQIGAIKP